MCPGSLHWGTALQSEGGVACAGRVSGRGEAVVSGCAVSASGCCCTTIPLVERHGLHCNILRSHVITVRGRLIPGSDECDYTLGLRWGQTNKDFL